MADVKIASRFTPYFVVHTEQGRKGLATCRACGALVDVESIPGQEADSGLLLHVAWHKAASDARGGWREEADRG